MSLRDKEPCKSCYHKESCGLQSKYYIYEDKIENDYCAYWLDDAIMQENIP